MTTELQRNDWGKYLTSIGLVNRAVEVGTNQAELAEQILLHWPGHLTCVDPWIDMPEYVGDPVASNDRNQDFHIAKDRLEQFGDRCFMFRCTSSEAAPAFKNESLDFVYIDANHNKPFVEQDIRLWWPKVKVGGILAGHDFVNASWPDVKEAVEEFVAANKLKLHHTTQPWGEWWVVK